MVMQIIDFYSSLEMPPTRYEEIFRMLDTGKLRPADAISGTIDLESVNEELEAMVDFETVSNRSSKRSRV